MGRHSASDDARSGSRPESRRARARAGRGSVAEPAPEVPEPALGAWKPRRESAIRADLRLLRADRRLRIRCAVGLAVPFVALLVVLLLLGRVGSFFIWLWIPAILGGVTFGSLLDRAHHKAAVTAAASGETAERAQ